MNRLFMMVAVTTPTRVVYVTCALLVTLFLLIVMQVLHKSAGEGFRKVPGSLMNALIVSLVASFSTAIIYFVLPGVDGGRPSPNTILLIRVRDFGIGLAVASYGWGLLRVYWKGPYKRLMNPPWTRSPKENGEAYPSPTTLHQDSSTQQPPLHMAKIHHKA